MTDQPLPPTTKAVVDALEHNAQAVTDALTTLSGQQADVLAKLASMNTGITQLCLELATLNHALSDRASGCRVKLDMDSGRLIKPEVVAVGETLEQAREAATNAMRKLQADFPPPPPRESATTKGKRVEEPKDGQDVGGRQARSAVNP